MTLGELKQAVDKDTKFELESPFMVDIKAISVTNTTPQNSDKIIYLTTENPNYQTKEGIRVGSTIKEAETIYGNAALSYNTSVKSREYVEFEKLPFNKNINFRPNSIKYKGFASIYANLSRGYNQAENYRDDAQIASIEVSCRPNNCP